jgi:hypothetical protein
VSVTEEEEEEEKEVEERQGELRELNKGPFVVAVVTVVVISGDVLELLNG